MRREPEVIVLGPPLVGMVVALGTLQTHAQEQLGRRLGQVLLQELFVSDRLGRHRDAVEVHRCVTVGLAGRGEQLADGVIERRIALDTIPQPGLEFL